MSRDLFTDRDTARALFAHLQQRARTLGVDLPPPPEEPTTCCGRGCNGCVWDGFYDAAGYWWEESQWRLEDAAA
ncbi:oxidoreductase-like domain-containing protein [Azohydromonas aeria]|uniref:oxidoreductase-like domain-containing protein n=1 Tax=Azohydromonas aeria TaxID=2590212 RepID=UPI0012FA20B4|nr:oxidoreductase-like domain-containing protein [Azohydromonas aeria]